MPSLELSVLIPTHARPDKLNRCLAHLARQIDPPDFEIHIGVDDAVSNPQSIDIPKSLRGQTHSHPYPKLGYIAIRRRLLAVANGRFFLSLNDDAYPHPDCLRAHASLHETDRPRIVTGPAPFSPIDKPNLFDRLVHETPLVFFPPTESSATVPYRTDFRNCYGLNQSAPTALAREFGGFPDLTDTYGYDDIELAHRLITSANAEALHHPNAIVSHDHRFTPHDVHRREYLLGRSAWAYAGLNPTFSQDLFGRNIRSDHELEYSRGFLEQQHADAIRIERLFLDLANQPASAASDTILPTLAQQWVPLKRFLWRWGLLDAAAERPTRWSLLVEAPPLP